MATPTFFKIERGLFTHKISDHYAVLGLPLTADGTQIRAKYLSIVKALHPDVYGRSLEQKTLATAFLSKMINPAYQVLNNDRERNEYLAVLRLFAKSQQQKKEHIDLLGELSQKLANKPHEYTYNQYIQQLADQQYENLDQNAILALTCDLSELNLVYLLTQQNLTFVSSINSAKVATPAPETPPTSKPTVSPAQRNIQVAEILLANKQWSDALRELQAGFKLDSENASIYGMMGLAYMNMNNNSQAKVYFQKALQRDPKEANAITHLPKVEAAIKATPKPVENKSGGLFGWRKK